MRRPCACHEPPSPRPRPQAVSSRSCPSSSQGRTSTWAPKVRFGGSAVQAFLGPRRATRRGSARASRRRVRRREARRLAGPALRAREADQDLHHVLHQLQRVRAVLLPLQCLPGADPHQQGEAAAGWSLRDGQSRDTLVSQHAATRCFTPRAASALRLGTTRLGSTATCATPTSRPRTPYPSRAPPATPSHAAAAVAPAW